MLKSRKMSHIQDDDVTKILNSNLLSFSETHMKCYPGDGNIHPKDLIKSCTDNFTFDMTDSAKIEFVRRFLDKDALSWATKLLTQT